VTFVLTVHGRNRVFAVADRRLSYPGKRPPIDDAVKLMTLEADDGIGVLAYAGLGATSRGTQPSEWMASVFRGRTGSFEEGLGLLATVAAEQLPNHLRHIRGVPHSIVAAAFVKGRSRLYSIENLVDQAGNHFSESVSNVLHSSPDAPSARLALAGSGGAYLSRVDDGWDRRLFDLVKAADRGRIAPVVVADHLATLNYRVHLAVRDGTVGPNCIVVWAWKNGGESRQFYEGRTRAATEDRLVPYIDRGVEVSAMGSILFDAISLLVPLAEPVPVAVPEELVGIEITTYDIPAEGINDRMSRLPREPDDRLR
jgi:hypothetical protein